MPAFADCGYKGNVPEDRIIIRLMKGIEYLMI